MRVRARSLLRSLFLPWLVELLAANYRFNAVRAVLLLTKLLPAPEAAGVNLRLTHQLRREALRRTFTIVNPEHKLFQP